MHATIKLLILVPARPFEAQRATSGRVAERVVRREDGLTGEVR